MNTLVEAIAALERAVSELKVAIAANAPVIHNPKGEGKMSANYLNYSYDGERFYKNGKAVPVEEQKEIPTYIRLVLKDMVGEPIPACFSPVNGGQA